MKAKIVLFVIGTFFLITQLHAQCGQVHEKTPTSIGIILYSNDVETLWNALRFANFAKSSGDTVSIFLLGKGVELDILVKSNADLKDQTETFLGSGGTILGCGTCLNSRKMNEPQVCQFSSMSDLYDIVRKNKIVLTF
ncbi:MAG: DsrE family protein [Bacteroidales bacterium]|nr:DsrE family protein [Bacteroidales bacterium]HOY38644.1 DsrE family protein [Bacteroidales bacterium]HQP05148.1 DsrE family protein [Bacteroidales bacterium]